MKRLILVTSLLLLTSGWMLAQYESSGAGSSYSNDSQATTSDSNSQGSGMATTTVAGCLSENNGQFTLTDQSGQTFGLTGKTSQLKAHVGHTIRVTGKVTGSDQNQPGSMSGEQVNSGQSLSVISFRHVSSTCKNPMH